MNYTDEQLKQALAKMLPYVISYREVIAYESGKPVCLLQWGTPWNDERDFMVRDTELLHLCWLVEKGLNPEQKFDYIEILGRGEDEESFYPTIALASDWRWRAAALAVLKGIEI